MEASDADVQKYNKAKRSLENYLESIIWYETPFRHCYYIKNTIWLKNIAVYNAYSMQIYFGVYAILNKMNLISVFYWISLWRVLSLNFKPNIFKQDKSTLLNPSSVTRYNLKAGFDTFKNQQMNYLLKCQILMISLFIIWQYAFSVYTNVQFSSQESLQRGISNVFCPDARRQVDEDQYDEDGNIF